MTTKIVRTYLDGRPLQEWMSVYRSLSPERILQIQDSLISHALVLPRQPAPLHSVSALPGVPPHPENHRRASHLPHHPRRGRGANFLGALTFFSPFTTYQWPSPLYWRLLAHLTSQPKHSCHRQKALVIARIQDRGHRPLPRYQFCRCWQPWLPRPQYMAARRHRLSSVHPSNRETSQSATSPREPRPKFQDHPTPSTPDTPTRPATSPTDSANRQTALGDEWGRIRCMDRPCLPAAR